MDAFEAGKSLSLRHNFDAACGTQDMEFANVATASPYEHTPCIGNSSKSGCATVGQKMFWTLTQRCFPDAEQQHGNGSGTSVTAGWVKQGGQWCCLGADGAPQTGWLKDGSRWYYLSSSGRMQTSWIELSGKSSFLRSNGATVTGNQVIDGTADLLASSGRLLA